MKVYIVEGSCGEYDDHYTWAVAAYLDNRELAKEHTRLAQEYFLNLRKIHSVDEISKLVALGELRNPYDTSMSCSYTGPSYFFYELDVLEKLPEAV